MCPFCGGIGQKIKGKGMVCFSCGKPVVASEWKAASETRRAAMAARKAEPKPVLTPLPTKP